MADGVNVVNVNARIKPAQIITSNNRDMSSSRDLMVTRVDLNPSDQRANKKTIKLSGPLSIEIGSNVSWTLSAKQENLADLETHLNSYGWTIEEAVIQHGGNTYRISSKFTAIGGGDNGSFSIDLRYQLVLRTITSEQQIEPPQEDVQSVIALKIS